MLNRALGLGVERAATEADVDAVLGAFDPGVTYYVAVETGARPPELTDWLRARGLEPSWGWMLFTRAAGDPPPAGTALRLKEITAAEEADAFARVVRTGFGLDEASERVVARAPGCGWRCWLALDGDAPATAAALYVHDDVGYLGLAATLPEHRGKGGQGALLAARIRQAAELGCDLVATETGERRDDRPSNSYRNILRAGFAEEAVTANWLGRA